MDWIANELKEAAEQLMGRASGPMHFRLLFQPFMAGILAVRAGLKDAREGRPAFLWELITNAGQRKQLLASGWKDTAKIFTVAVVLDIVYGLVALGGFFPFQTLLVAVLLALVPYFLLRGPVTRIARRRSPSP